MEPTPTTLSHRDSSPGVGAICFKLLWGFKVHKRKLDNYLPTGQHTKVRLDSQGSVRLTTKTFTVSKKSHAARDKKQAEQLLNSFSGFYEAEIPECVDNLPPEVDLSILDAQPRKQTASQERDDQLRELICLEGRCSSPETCSWCKEQPAILRCEDCLGIDMYCPLCALSYHQHNPLHRMKEWNGSYFERKTLKELGLWVQLGHPVGTKCCRPRAVANGDFVTIHNNGVHEINIDFCGCETAEMHTRQLLRMRWFPTSSDKPPTAATFTVLEQYHLLSLESKVSTYEYYSALARTSNNTKLLSVKDHYEQFMRMARKWRHLKLLKRFLYALFVAIDANFRLKRKVVSKDSKSSCSSHNAVNMANTKSTKRLAVTGVGTVECARHNFKRPCGTADLQVDTYVNMDYVFLSTVRSTGLKTLKVSYDIACQWHKNLRAQMATLPEDFWVDFEEMDITFLVPKFHLPAHIAACQPLSSFNWIPGAPERGWANINPVASSTKKMGPGHRRDTLDDHFCDWNWKKVTGLGAWVLCKIQEAVPERNEHLEYFNELTQFLNSKYPELLVKWQHEVEEWELDLTKPNPFVIKTTESSVRLQLAQDEAKIIASSKEPPLHPDVTPSVLIGAGINLEDQQRCLCIDRANLGQHVTDMQKSRVQQRSNGLMCRLEAWSNIQTLFIPGVSNLRNSATPITAGKLPLPEDFALHLPSQLCRSVACPLQLGQIKWQLCKGQAHDALNDYMLKFKDRFLHSQGANTRAHNCLKSVDAKVNASAAKYRAAHVVLCALGPLLKKVGWMTTLDTLANEDIPIQLEWCKTLARANRWSEEVELLFEEQRQILAFFGWHATWWSEKTNTVRTDEEAYAKGLQAYAKRQAALRQQLASHFRHMWRNTRRLLDLANNVGMGGQ
ncbi:hypothetical protein PAXINDRAFT_164291 [Paxillus involutus ATCC 200175]|uniref:CxC2-like cysteine cluster KDZ transposase-associated domain-containing protein n=1 Tax=Paxillus involutus ATCC 200175 TaxID=664439 RepID=A0A0C9SR71_PAXIN|nr:hypothetical protein PAXINDRAFT_164291 [Paxillus involutus ATCC 200175]